MKGERFMRKKIALLLSFILLVSLTGCNKTTPSESEGTSSSTNETSTSAQESSAEDMAVLSGSYQFNVGSSSPVGTTISKTMAYVEENAASRTDGQLVMKYYGASQLGNDSELLTECVGGNIPIVVMTTASLVGTVSQLGVFDMYCAISEEDTLSKMMSDKDFRETIQGWFEEAGLKLIMWDPVPSKQIAATKTIDSFDDLKGYNMRTLSNSNHIAFWNAVGANPTTVVASELYLAVQQGLVDALEMNMAAILSYKVAEVTNYIYKSSLLPHMACVVMNLDAYNSMSEEDKAWFDEFCDEMNENFYETSLADEEAAWNTVQEQYNMTVLDFDSEVFQQMKSVAEETEWETIRTAIGDKAVDDYLNAIKAAEE